MRDAAAACDSPLPVLPRAPAALDRIVLRLPSWLGDVVMAGPAVQAIAAARPGAEVVAAVRPPLQGLAALLPGVDRTVSIGRERGPGGVLHAARAYDGLDAGAIVLFPRGARAMLAPRLARVPVRLGFGAPLQRRLLTHAIEGWRPWRKVHRTRWFGLLARPFGAAPTDVPVLAPPAALREEARRLLRSLGRRGDGPLVALEPGAAYGEAKCWPRTSFAGLAARLVANGREVLVVGSAATAPIEAVIARRARILRAAGRTPDLGLLAACLAEADLVVANDTGPMHVAAAVGTPVLALFGATDPAVSGPAGSGPRRILWRPAPCSPCFLRTCVVEGHPCLAVLDVATVEREAEDLLARTAPGRR